MLSKNFLPTHQLDADFCTGFLCASHWGKYPSRRVSNNRAFCCARFSPLLGIGEGIGGLMRGDPPADKE